MIYGIGTDIVKISRVEKIFKIYGDRFARRILTIEELSQYHKANDKARFLAMRFAAKESITKAMGIGFSKGLRMRDIGIDQNKSGKPFILFSDNGKKIKENLGIGEGYITLSDDYGVAIAFSILMSKSINY